MFTYDKALTDSVKYFNGNELAAKVFVDKYALRDTNGNILENTPEKTHRRLASEFARIEAKKFKEPLTEEYIFGLFDKFQHIIPQGSPTFAIGNNHQIASASNCFVVESPVDSYGGICKTDQELVQISKRRGGVGLDLSNLRPKGSVTNNSSRSSTGIKSWMQRYSNSIREVGQSGRRGALMLTLSIHHPDVVDFITAKNNDTDVTGANISLRLTNEFLKAVQNNEQYELRFPVDSKEPTVSKKVDAKAIWDLIIKNAHARAEPGILFWDNILNESIPDCYERYITISTNPCITGDTLIAVADGRNAVSIKQLTDERQDIPVYSTNLATGQVEIKMGRNPRLTGKSKEVWKLLLDDGTYLLATPDHKILTKDRKYVNLQDLKSGESIFPFYSYESNKYRQVCNTGAKMKGGARRNRRQYRLIHEFYNGSIDPKVYAIHHADFNSKNDNIDNLEVMTHKDHRELHSKNMVGTKNPYHRMTDEWKSNFASHPGEQNHKYSGFTNEELIEHGKLCFQKYGKISNKIWGKYAKENGLPQFLGNKFRFGNFSNFKNQVCSNHKVVSVSFHGYEDVYNITVDDNHNYHIITSGDDTFVRSSGICVKNCGEITLSANDSCRLLVENLMYFVRNAFTKDAYFDFRAFYESAQIAQRLMDDLVDIELEKIQTIIDKITNDPERSDIKQAELDLWIKIQVACHNGRRTGLGITGLGDVVAACGYKYGSDESIKFIEKIYQTLKFGSYRASVDMAKELGAFPDWDWQKEKNNPFLNRIKDEWLDFTRPAPEGFINQCKPIFGKELFADMQKYGRRNIANLTTAPVGSMSMLAGFTINGEIYYSETSGIEPVYSWKPYTRRKKGNPGDNNFRTDFVDQSGDHWMEFPVFHSGIEAWMKVTGKTEIDETCPYVGASAEEIDWPQRVKLQAAAQKHVDHSISSTVNLPSTATEEDVAKIYTEAWKSGCKGITVYRDGCRTGVLVTNKEEKTEKITKVHAPKRPKSLSCDIYNISVSKNKYTVVVGLLEGEPYEVFCVSDYIDKHKHGLLVKNGKGDYIVKTGDDEVRLSNYLEDDTQNALLRLISASLRHGASIHFIVEQLQKTKGDLTSFNKCIARALKKYINDGTSSSQKCECGSELIYQEGCLICRNCAYSKCS